MSVSYLLMCFCFNYFVCGSEESSNLCKTNELLKEISSLKNSVTRDNEIIKERQLNLMKDLKDLQEENKALKGALQDLNRLFGNETQSIKEDFLDMVEEIKSLKNITQSIDGQIQLCPMTDPVSPTSSTCSRHGSNSPTDCSDIFAGGGTKSGTYKIFPNRNQLNKSLEVFCDMDDGEGWTVFLLRDAAAQHVDFNRNWSDYKEFFGSADQEYWIGNENLHALTSQRNYEVRFEAKDGRDYTWVRHKFFSVDSEENGYQLTLGRYDRESTTMEHFGFGWNSGQNFSTYDNDNDGTDSTNCAEEYKGGWWYAICSWIYPTGIHGKKHREGVSVSYWSKEHRKVRYPGWLQFRIHPTN